MKEDAHHAVLDDILPEDMDVAADFEDREGGGTELGPRGRPRGGSAEAEQAGKAAHAPCGACMERCCRAGPEGGPAREILISARASAAFADVIGVGTRLRQGVGVRANEAICN